MVIERQGEEIIAIMSIEEARQLTEQYLYPFQELMVGIRKKLTEYENKYESAGEEL